MQSLGTKGVTTWEIIYTLKCVNNIKWQQFYIWKKLQVTYSIITEHMMKITEQQNWKSSHEFLLLFYLIITTWATYLRKVYFCNYWEYIYPLHPCSYSISTTFVGCILKWCFLRLYVPRNARKRLIILHEFFYRVL